MASVKPTAPSNPQASVLRRELASITKQTVFEAHRLSELQQTLDREQQSIVSSEHAASILRREQEIQRIRDEKTAMTEWLQRGVAEAQRIAQQIELLAETNLHANATADDLEKENEQLSAMEKRLREELQTASAKLISVREHRDILVSEAQHITHVVGAASNVVTEVSRNKETLEEEMESLKIRMRDCEVIEIACSCLGAAVRRALHETEILHGHSSRGEFVENSDEDEDYDSEVEEGQQQEEEVKATGEGGSSSSSFSSTVFPPAILARARANCTRVDGLLIAMASCLDRFGSDQSVREMQKRRNHQELVREATAELDDLHQRSEYHIKALTESNRRREPLLRQYLQLRNERMAQYKAELLAGSGTVSMEPFNLLGVLEEENAALVKARDNTMVEYQQCKSKAESAEADFRAVKEMKRLYRELETQKTMLSHEIRSAEQDNKSRKLQLWGMGPVTGVAAATAAGSAGRSPKPKPWRAVQSQY